MERSRVFHGKICATLLNLPASQHPPPKRVLLVGTAVPFPPPWDGDSLSSENW